MWPVIKNERTLVSKEAVLVNAPKVKTVTKIKMAMRLNVGIAVKRGTLRQTVALRSKPTRNAEEGKSKKPKRALLLLLKLLILQKKL